MNKLFAITVVKKSDESKVYSSTDIKCDNLIIVTKKEIYTMLCVESILDEYNSDDMPDITLWYMDDDTYGEYVKAMIYNYKFTQHSSNPTVLPLLCPESGLTVDMVIGYIDDVIEIPYTVTIKKFNDLSKRISELEILLSGRN